MNDETKQNEDNTNEAQAQGGAEQGANEQARAYALQRMYLKDVSFESPNSPDIFTMDWKPHINLNLGSTSRSIDENLYEVILKVSVEAKVEDKTAFLIELEQAGIFHAQGFEPQELHRILGQLSPEHLYPFAREAVASMAMHGGFPQLLLQPINFEALYHRTLEEKMKMQEQQGGNA
ncbi:MAG: protein-export chaperone SecB [Gammaproteobacteria bacterium]|nr:protein-export chaperone SecB [Gammaproteobacteria bacterium]